MNPDAVITKAFTLNLFEGNILLTLTNSTPHGLRLCDAEALAKALRDKIALLKSGYVEAEWDTPTGYPASVPLHERVKNIESRQNDIADQIRDLRNKVGELVNRIEIMEADTDSPGPALPRGG